MIRLTATLLVLIGVTMAVAGRDTGGPEGSDQPRGVEVTRLDPAPAPGLLQADTSRPAASDTRTDVAAIPLEDEEMALRAAIAASEAGRAPEPPQPVETATAAPEADTVSADSAFWYVTGNRVNLRQGPSTGTSVIGQVTLGQKARVLEETDGGWYRIETADGAASGFIFGRFLTREEPL